MRLETWNLVLDSIALGISWNSHSFPGPLLRGIFYTGRMGRMGRMGLVKARKNDWLLYFEQLPFGNATGENWRRELCECWQMPPWKTWTAILERSNDRLWQTQHDSTDFILGTGHLLTVQWPEEMIWYGQMMAVKLRNLGEFVKPMPLAADGLRLFGRDWGEHFSKFRLAGLPKLKICWRYCHRPRSGSPWPHGEEKGTFHEVFSVYIYIYISCICIWFAAKVMGTCSEYCLMSLKIASSFIDTPIELDDTLGGWLSVMFPKPWWVLTMFYPWQKTTEHVFFLRILWVYWMTVIILFYMCRTAPNKRESLEQLGNSWGADINLGKISARTREPSEVWFRTILRGHLGKKTQKS